MLCCVVVQCSSGAVDSGVVLCSVVLCNGAVRAVVKWSGSCSGEVEWCSAVVPWTVNAVV